MDGLSLLDWQTSCVPPALVWITALCLPIPDLNILLSLIYCVQHVEGQEKHSTGIPGSTALPPLPYHALYSE